MGARFIRHAPGEVDEEDPIWRWLNDDMQVCRVCGMPREKTCRAVVIHHAHCRAVGIYYKLRGDIGPKAAVDAAVRAA